MPSFSKKATIQGLNITRKQGERIIVNNGEILIEVVEVKGRYVRLVFQANKEIKITREIKSTEGTT